MLPKIVATRTAPTINMLIENSREFEGTSLPRILRNE